VGVVEAVAGAELDHAAGEAGEQLAAVLGDATGIGTPAEAPLQAREDRVTDLIAHGVLPAR
jgi:hypothetical protein